MKYCFNDLNSLYSDFKDSARNAFGTYWEEELGSEKIPENFRNCIEEMTSAIKRAMRIADIVATKHEVAAKQRELEEVKSTLKDLESSDLRNTESANQ